MNKSPATAEEAQLTGTPVLKWQDVPITNNFMFSKIMSDKTLCKEFLEVMLEIRIDHLEEISTESTLKTDLYAKGVRFDVYVQDSSRVFDIEMQMCDTRELPKRARYYQSVCDVDTLDAGSFYSDLKETYVLFICPFDLFGRELPCYTFENTCSEIPSIKLGDKTHKLFFNFNAYTKELNKNRRSVLEYFAEGKSETPLAQQLDRRLEEAKVNAKWRTEFMTLEMELIAREKIGLEKGISQGITQGITQGEHEKAIAVAKKLLGMKLSIQQIAEATGLTEKEIKSIK